MAYIGSSAAPIPVNFSAVQSQGFNGTGSQTAFTMARSVATPSAIEVLVNNVQQSPFDGSYTVSGTTLTFSEAPSTGTNNVYVIYRDQPVGSLIDTGAVRKSGDTITGQLIVEGSNGAVTVRGASTGAQLKLERTASSQGHGYLGADAGYALRVYNSAFADGLRVDQSGRVTMPYQPSFRAAFGVSSPTAYVSGSRLLNFTSVAFNIGNHYDGINKFTAPVTGRYVFIVSRALNTLGPSKTIRHPSMSFMVNGSGVYGINTGVASGGDLPSGDYAHFSIGMNAVLDLQAGDYVQVNFAYLNDYGILYEYSNNYFSGYLLG